MGYRPSRGRRLAVAFAFMIAVAVPVFFIANAYRDRENGPLIALTGLRETETSVPNAFVGLPATWTPLPTITPRNTTSPTPTTTPSPSTTLGFDFSGAFISEVVHLTENGPQTMVKIVVPGLLEREYEANVEIGTTRRDFVCLMLEESEDHLFCVGARLPSRSFALIQVYLVDGGGEDPILVFEENFTVPPFFVATPTQTRRPAPTPKPKKTATPTPIPTNTIVPTNPPAPTATCPPQPTAPPWASPTPPGNPLC